MTLSTHYDIRRHIDSLLRIKMSNDESKVGKRIAEVDVYMENTMAKIEKQMQLLPKTQKSTWKNLMIVSL